MVGRVDSLVNSTTAAKGFCQGSCSKVGQALRRPGAAVALFPADCASSNFPQNSANLKTRGIKFSLTTRYLAYD